MTAAYEFTNSWFEGNKPTWSQVVQQFRPARIAEIGSYEGQSTCFLIRECGALHPVELHCIDSWEGGVEHDRGTMGEVEARFDRNVARAKAETPNPVQVIKHKSYSHPALARMNAEGKAGAFDLIYVDGSHQAPDVLADAVFAFPLLKVGGIMIFDDYLWSMEQPGQQDSFNMPKPAIDAFINIYQRKVRVLSAPLYQLYVMKLAD